MVRRKPDYALKSKILKEHNKLLHELKKSSLYSKLYENYLVDGVYYSKLERLSNETKLIGELFQDYQKIGLEKEFNECIKINNASYKKVQRLKHRISKMLIEGNCIFLTLTFSQQTLDNTTTHERRKAVVRFLKTCSSSYVANIDFGKDNEREHYHAIVLTNSVNYKEWNKFGIINGERIRLKGDNKDSERLSKYITKLTNHAIKETTKRNAVIYSR